MESKAESLEHIIDSYQEQIMSNPSKFSKLKKLKIPALVAFAAIIAKYFDDLLFYYHLFDLYDLELELHEKLHNILYNRSSLYRYLYDEITYICNKSLEKLENVAGYVAKAGKSISTFIHNCPDTVKYIAAGVCLTAALVAFYYYYKRRKRKDPLSIIFKNSYYEVKS